MQISKEAVDTWCSGRSRPSPEKLGRLVTILEEHGIPPAHLRDLLADALTAWGLDESVTRNYLGLHRVPIRHDAFVIVAWDLRSELQQVAATLVRKNLSEAGREVVVLDCCGSPAMRRHYLQVLVPSLQPAGLIVSKFGRGTTEIDAVALQFAQLGVPTVYFQEGPRLLPDNAGYVSWDDYHLGYRGGQDACLHRPRKIGIVFYDGVTIQSSRKAGFEAALKDSGQSPDVVKSLSTPITMDPFHDDLLLNRIQRFLDEEQPDLVFTPSPIVAFTLIQAANLPQSSSRRKFSVLAPGCPGWMTSWMRSSAQPELRIVHIPVERAARESAELVLKLSGGTSLSKEERIVQIDPEPNSLLTHTQKTPTKR
ncbi:MAG: LacI family DNA-binding transcriptional regulator [Chloroflexi bacterium]|nr:LacI family DNA-binding transcriptional regulator [Chloroflexota bacterium]